VIEKKPIRVLIVDDHAVVRRGLAVSLMTIDEIELVGEASDGSEAVLLCHQLHPDVILMDMVMPGVNGVEATQAIHQTFPDIRIIILTSFKEADMVQEALRAGAVSYLLKDASIDQLVTSIQEAIAGHPSLAPEVTQALISLAIRPAPAGYSLTERELEILSLMVKGLTNPQIAEQLVISRSTVKFHVSAILSKLGVASRTEAVALALQQNLVK
jgi:NarL family two-component system response regulator LiaR